jgi:CRISPR-associated endonuclease/helicase Cas3
LVDADYLDTEAHFGDRSEALRGAAVPLSELWARFEHDQNQLSGQRTDPVNSIRHAIYQACLQAAQESPGLYRLTVPTGGGKTRSGLGFALRHALTHGMNRIVIAIPYISITEQTAGTLRDILERPGEPPVVLEHHSAVTFTEDEAGTVRQEWTVIDRPIIGQWCSPDLGQACSPHVGHS